MERMLGNQDNLGKQQVLRGRRTDIVFTDGARQTDGTGDVQSMSTDESQQDHQTQSEKEPAQARIGKQGLAHRDGGDASLRERRGDGAVFARGADPYDVMESTSLRERAGPGLIGDEDVITDGETEHHGPTRKSRLYDGIHKRVKWVDGIRCPYPYAGAPERLIPWRAIKHRAQGNRKW